MANNKNKEDRRLIDLDREMNKLVSNIERKVGNLETKTHDELLPSKAFILFCSKRKIDSKVLECFDIFYKGKYVFLLDKYFIANDVEDNLKIEELSEKSPKEINEILKKIPRSYYFSLKLNDKYILSAAVKEIASRKQKNFNPYKQYSDDKSSIAKLVEQGMQ